MIQKVTTSTLLFSTERSAILCSSRQIQKNPQKKIQKIVIHKMEVSPILTDVTVIYKKICYSHLFTHSISEDNETRHIKKVYSSSRCWGNGNYQNVFINRQKKYKWSGICQNGLKASQVVLRRHHPFFSDGLVGGVLRRNHKTVFLQFYDSRVTKNFG